MLDLLRSRSVWVVAGNTGTFLGALAGLVSYWSRPLSFAGCAVVVLVCLACQAVALIPVVRPGRAPCDLHQNLTVATVCGSWVFGVCPGAGLLVLFDVDVDSPPWAALFLAGTALMVACVAGLITATAVSGGTGTPHPEGAGPPGVPDVDTGGPDGD
ncbi:hypothetical protein [Streptomyces sp. NPDC005876]|uniref:hypothetical protein n=1 Tax=unclassified Streptomyces TaxID=2593676 RepID=UPI0033E91211